MTTIKNDRLLRTIAREPIDRTPIWIMRQAGRYLPEYQRVRKQAGSFMNLCKTPELACEVTLQPLARFELDAAIIFSDILTIPDAMGLGLDFIEGKGPIFAKPTRTEQAIHKLTVPDLEQLNYVYEAIRLVNQELAGKLPLIGFCGSPWTLATYMIEGQAKTNFSQILAMLANEPKLLHHLLSILSQAVAAHLNAQIAAGVSLVMIFDTWGGILQPKNYLDFSLQYAKQILNALNLSPQEKKIPTILFTKGGGIFLDSMVHSGYDVLGLDWTIDLHEARQRVNNQVALQGNLNPEYLLLPPNELRQQVANTLDAYGKGSGHIFNLGHGITPNVPPEQVTILIEAVHEFSQSYHQ